MKKKNASVILNKNQYTKAIEKAVTDVYKAFGIEPTCTSGNDGKHMVGSLHYKDRALDIRFWDVLDFVAWRIREHLPPYYDVVREKDHFHLEADPKKEAAWIKTSTPT